MLGSSFVYSLKLFTLLENEEDAIFFLKSNPPKNLDMYGMDMDSKLLILVDALIESNIILDTLNISNADIGNFGAEQIAKLIKSNFNIRSIVISNNNIGPDGAKMLALALPHNQYLKGLNLCSSNFGSDGGNFFAESSSPSLCLLCLSGNKLRFDTVMNIISNLSSYPKMLDLDLELNRIDEVDKKNLRKFIRKNRKKHNIHLTVYF
jgi:Ran GTPase-activating protein (RanGAP) involved in mRNA processing and transport